MKFVPSFALLRAAALLIFSLPSQAGVIMEPLTDFSGDGFFAPGEGGYAFLGTGAQERGLAYNKVTDHLLLASRNGNVVRILNAATGEDLGSLPNSNGFSGGTFVMNMIGVGDDGAVFVANLQGNIGNNPFKVYRWESETAEPTVFVNKSVSNLTGTIRVGDTLDVIGSGADVRVITGINGGIGYMVVKGRTGEDPEPAIAGDIIPVMEFTPAGPAINEFRLGITFAGTPQEVWGRQTSGTGRRTTYKDTGTGHVYDGALTGITGTKAAMDFAIVGGRPLLAVLDMNTAATPGIPAVYVYDVTTPNAPSLAASLSTASGLGTANANGNGVGSVAWGRITPGTPNSTATLYAMATNQGIQAFTVTVTPEVTPVSIATPPVSRSVLERGVVSFTVSATGSPPLSYQWRKGTQDIPGATEPTLTIRPVTAAGAGDYSCRVNNPANAPVDSAAATLTVVPGVDTNALTELWHLAPGSRPYLTEGSTQRGLACNPATGRLYLATRTPAPAVQILSAADGSAVGSLDVTGLNGGEAGFLINMVAVAEDGAIYACNLSKVGDGSEFRVYQWPGDEPNVPPASVLTFDNPAGVRIGDSLAARGAGKNTELVAGTLSSGAANHFVIFRTDDSGFFTPYPVTVTGAGAEAFQTSVAFGSGRTVWGKDHSRNVVVASYDVDEVTGLPTGTGTLLATFGGPPLAGAAIAVDSVNGFLAHIHTGDSDNVRLYDLPSPAPATLTLLDQEFYTTDNANDNGTGSVVFAAGKLYALDTNNGLSAYTVTRPPPAGPDPVITEVTQSGGNVVFKLRATVGKTYLIEKSSRLTPRADWTADGTVNQNAAEETVTRPIPAGTPRLFFRAREQ